MLTRFIFEEEGQTLVEYGLMVSLIALVVVMAVTLLGRTIRENLFESANNQYPAPTTN